MCHKRATRHYCTFLSHRANDAGLQKKIKNANPQLCRVAIDLYWMKGVESVLFRKSFSTRVFVEECLIKRCVSECLPSRKGLFRPMACPVEVSLLSCYGSCEQRQLHFCASTVSRVLKLGTRSTPGQLQSKPERPDVRWIFIRLIIFFLWTWSTYDGTIRLAQNTQEQLL